MTRNLYVLFILIFSSFCSLNAQVIGKIFDANYANNEFGAVVRFIEVDNDELKSMLDIAGEYIMLNIESGNLRALNNDRNSVLGSADSDTEVFYKMSTSQVYLLLQQGSKKTTNVEMRPKTLTLTNGIYTLELTQPCPPFCN